MEDYFIIALKLAGVLSTIILGIVAAPHRLWLGRKIQSDLFEVFRGALEREDKHAVVMMFWRLHRVRMKYGDILALIRKDDFLEIIRYMQHRRKHVCFRNCTLTYVKTDFKRGIERAVRVQRCIGCLFGILFLGIGVIFTLGEGLVSLFGLAIMVFGSVFWVVNEESARLDKDMVDFIESESSGLAG